MESGCDDNVPQWISAPINASHESISYCKVVSPNRSFEERIKFGSKTVSLKKQTFDKILGSAVIDMFGDYSAASSDESNNHMSSIYEKEAHSSSSISFPPRFPLSTKGSEPIMRNRNMMRRPPPFPNIDHKQNNQKKTNRIINNPTIISNLKRSGGTINGEGICDNNRILRSMQDHRPMNIHDPREGRHLSFIDQESSPSSPVPISNEAPSTPETMDQPIPSASIVTMKEEVLGQGQVQVQGDAEVQNSSLDDSQWKSHYEFLENISIRFKTPAIVLSDSSSSSSLEQLRESVMRTHEELRQRKIVDWSLEL